MSLKRTIHPTFIYALPRNFRGCLQYSTSTPAAIPEATLIADNSKPPNPVKEEEEEEESALSRRFSALAEDALLASPHSAEKLAHEPTAAAAISEELKRALTDRIAATDFASEHAQSISLTNLPSSASKHTRDLAASKPWTGTESQEDVVLRMLTDVHKPLKQKAVPQTVVDLRPHHTFGPKPDRATRIASARDKSLEYTLSKDDDAAERSAIFRERFQPYARPVASVSALMSLADQRIEDARARGQFDDIPRGKPRVEDHNARSPYLDTTEYFLNKMIQKQNILPPWVEKQQELGRAAGEFRRRIRNDWKRFVARTIAAKGGTLEEQCRRADVYAAAEARRVRLMKMEKRVQMGEDVSAEELRAAGEGPTKLFRDTEWAERELKYDTLAIEGLNSLCRSYNMMAPEIARRPIFTLERELDRCYEDVAPEVAQEIRERARKSAPPRLRFSSGTGGTPFAQALGGGGGHQAMVRDSEKPNYGLGDFVKDVFGWGKK